MLCEKCNKNEATYYYHENVNGNEKTYRLCSECARKMEKDGEIKKSSAYFDGVDSMLGDIADPFKSMGKLFSGLFGESVSPAGKAQLREEKKCSCGMTLREFASSGRAGCPECYDSFGGELEYSIKRIHGKSSHEGRSPVKFRAKQDIKRRIESLEREQSEAIKNENYERAAEIRDMLKDMRAAEGGE